LALGVTGSFSPISRETKPASGFLVLPRFDTKLPETFLLTQEPSIGGFSGAPIIDTGLPRLGEGNAAIKISDAPLGLVGTIHGTLSDPTGGKMGAVVPTYYLWELLTDVEGEPPKQ
jgi:hypothetical protein